MCFHFSFCFWNKTPLIACSKVLVSTLNFSFSLQKSKYGLTCDLVLQFLECLLMFIIPFSFIIFLELIERFCYVTEILYKVLIEVYKFQKAFHFFYLGKGFLLFDYLDFIVFHLNFSSSNYYSQYRYLFNIKVAL